MEKFRFVNLIISQIFLSMLSMKLSLISTNWILGEPTTKTVLEAFIVLQLVILIISFISIFFILSNINYALFVVGSPKERKNN